MVRWILIADLSHMDRRFIEHGSNMDRRLVAHGSNVYRTVDRTPLRAQKLEIAEVVDLSCWRYQLLVSSAVDELSR
jgi:hypothetical protein